MIKLGIDFDGVICKREGIPTIGDWQKCEPVNGARESIELFIKQGIGVYICTQREHYDWPEVKEWLKKRGFPELRITNKKEKDTTVYIDDRAIRFTNWNDIRKLFN